jgi:hypothetical protein
VLGRHSMVDLKKIMYMSHITWHEYSFVTTGKRVVRALVDPRWHVT